MGDTNKTRAKQKNEERKNKEAFIEIIGDPFKSEPIEGCYLTLQSRSAISSIEEKLGQSVGTVNAAKPSTSDFFCDVENVIRDSVPKDLHDSFILCYFEGDDKAVSKGWNKRFEQIVGKLLRVRGISPIKRYFTVTQKRKP